MLLDKELPSPFSVFEQESPGPVASEELNFPLPHMKMTRLRSEVIHDDE